MITPGFLYLDHRSLYDGRWTSEAMCFVCWWVRESFGRAHGMFPTPAALFDELRNCVGDEGDWRTEFAIILNRRRTAHHETNGGAR